MLAMVVNDDAGSLTPRGALSGFSRACSLLQGGRGTSQSQVGFKAASLGF
ncbi:hypothetical protein PS918_03545 [Pseudomonas fluorescens]|uniref:Uncharacterized protein n=1 Tax=Pseudomonas fluorescens TaxID=294 RepID=A0A5E7T5E5_PSEFL|nr:hypothetical protein PS918_03545 [Pseudomonas fluorescens]